MLQAYVTGVHWARQSRQAKDGGYKQQRADSKLIQEILNHAAHSSSKIVHSQQESKTMTQAETETAMRDCDGAELRPGDQVEFVNECIEEVRGRIATVLENQEIPLGNQLDHMFDPHPLVRAALDGEEGCVRASDIRKVQAEETA